MKKFKDLNACISLLKEVGRGNSIDPQRKQAIEQVIGEVQKIRRKPHLGNHELHESVRIITETLIRIFLNRD
jgi:hypothetical protein